MFIYKHDRTFIHFFLSDSIFFFLIYHFFFCIDPILSCYPLFFGPVFYHNILAHFFFTRHFLVFLVREYADQTTFVGQMTLWPFFQPWGIVHDCYLSCAQPKLSELGGKTTCCGRKLFPTPPERNRPFKIAKDGSSSSPGHPRSG